MKRGQVLRPERVTRDMLRADRGTLYVFGDNMEHRGRGGQAREMRGEPNALGVPTKWRPSMAPDAFFSDADADNPRVQQAIREAFAVMEAALTSGRNVAIPAAGLGTGLAGLPAVAPRIHRAIEARIARLAGT